jgi:quercetin dioxygenase-like cupin family protein
MAEEPQPVSVQDWTPVAGSAGVDARVLLVRDGFLVALLRLAPASTVDERAAGHEVDVVCLEGEGYISVEDRISALAAGQRMTWPAGRVHRLWTGDHGMIVLLVDRL